MITAKEVANELGIAISTVGRALADDPRISLETKTRVQAAAERLGYVRNNPAQIMRGGSSNLVGLMIPDVQNDFYSSIAQVLSDCAHRQGYRLVLSLTGDDRDIELHHIRELVGVRAAGVIIVPTPEPKPGTRPMLARIPSVQLLRRVASFGDSWFGIDDRDALRRATEHVIEAGHRRIAYVGGYESLSTGASRVGGYREALAAAGRKIVSTEIMGEPSAGFGAGAARSLLKLKKPPTAIIAGSVHITTGLMTAVEDLGIRVPQDLSLVGFGSSPWFAWWHGGLTTISPPAHQLAMACGLWFLDRLKTGAPRAEAEAYSSVAVSSLVMRRSVAPPRRA